MLRASFVGILKVAGAVAAVTIVLFVIDRFLLWCEEQGWIYWRKRKASPGSLGSAFLELQAMLEPGKAHVVEEKTRVQNEQDDHGGLPEAGGVRREVELDLQPRKVEKIVTPQAVMEGAGVRLRRSIATRELDYVDPFLLLDHFGSDNPEDYIRGFPMHPHRGIETVTYMLSGFVEHKDSIGNAGRVGPGDVQWMTAGRGIMHEEMPQPGPRGMAGFQLWVNLPARLKMTQPRYQEVASDRIPEVKRADGTRIRVIAGKVDDATGAVSDIAADPTYLDVSVPAGATLSQPVPRGHAAFAYVFEGEGAFGIADGGQGTVAAGPRLLIFGDGDGVTVSPPAKPVRFLLVSGKPLHEPIARYGPFVMNTREEIQQALDDLRNGTFVR